MPPSRRGLAPSGRPPRPDLVGPVFEPSTKVAQEAALIGSAPSMLSCRRSLESPSSGKRHAATAAELARDGHPGRKPVPAQHGLILDVAGAATPIVGAGCRNLPAESVDCRACRSTRRTRLHHVTGVSARERRSGRHCLGTRLAAAVAAAFGDLRRQRRRRGRRAWGGGGTEPASFSGPPRRCNL